MERNLEELADATWMLDQDQLEFLLEWFGNSYTPKDDENICTLLDCIGFDESGLRCLVAVGKQLELENPWLNQYIQGLAWAHTGSMHRCQKFDDYVESGQDKWERDLELAGKNIFPEARSTVHLKTIDRLYELREKECKDSLSQKEEEELALLLRMHHEFEFAEKEVKKQATPASPLAVPAQDDEEEDVGRDVIKDGKFTFANIAVFLTYKTHLPKAELRKMACFGDAKEWYAAHESGDKSHPYPHTHVYCRWNGKRITESARFFDWIGTDSVIHPHIRVPTTEKHRKNCKRYLAKEDPECAALADDEPSVIKGIWDCPTVGDALLKHAKTPASVPGVVQAYKYKPRTPPRTRLPDREWQTSLIQELTKLPDDRTVVWYYDPVGGSGKTTLCRYLTVAHPNKFLVLNALGGDRDAATIIIGALENGWDGFCLFVDLSRSCEDKQIYSPIEHIKDGAMTATKYAGRSMVFDHPHVVVFANFLPNVLKLSLDRWDIREIRRADPSPFPSVSGSGDTPYTPGPFNIIKIRARDLVTSGPAGQSASLSPLFKVTS